MPKKFTCQICKEKKELDELTPATLVRPSIVALIKNKYKRWDPNGFICAHDLTKFRGEYIRHVIESQKGDFSSLESEVTESMKKHEMLANNINEEFEHKFTLGEKLSDKLAEFGGSWKFVTIYI